MAPGDQAARPRFSLNDEEDVEAVTSTSSAFAGLTIVPVPSVSSATGGWDIVGTGARGTPFAAASRASRSRGGVSVSSALTDVPSLSSFSPFAGGWVGGVLVLVVVVEVVGLVDLLGRLGRPRRIDTLLVSLVVFLSSGSQTTRRSFAWVALDRMSAGFAGARPATL